MTALSPKVIDSGKICRLCLMEDGELLPIFGEEENLDDERPPLSFKIRAIAPIELQEGDGLPEFICVTCIDMLNQAFRFRGQCERSDAVLRHHFGRLWPETNPELKKQVVMNLNKDFLAEQEPEEEQATCLVTVKHNKSVSDGIDDDDDDDDEALDEENDQSLDDDEYDDIPQDFSMDNEAVSLVKAKAKMKEMKPNPIPAHQQRPVLPTVPHPASVYSLADVRHLYIAEATMVPVNGINTTKDPATLALRETQNTTAPRVQPTPLTIPNVSVSLIRKNAALETAQLNAASNAQDPNKSRRWRKTNEPCSICGKCFKDRFAMKVHQRTHSGEKPFVCDICGKAFRQKAHLGKHSYTHKSERRPVPSNPTAPPSESGTWLHKILSEDKTTGKSHLPNSNHSQSITVPVPVLPLLQKQGIQSQASPPDPEPKPQVSPEPIPLTVTPTVSITPSTKPSSPLVILPKTTLSIPQITVPKPNVAFYVPGSGIPAHGSTKP